MKIALLTKSNTSTGKILPSKKLPVLKMMRCNSKLITCLLLSFCSILSGASKTSESETMKIISYNVYYGFNHSKSEHLGKQWLAEQQADVIALQELNGYTQRKLEQVARSWGHQHAVIIKEQGFPVGITAKEPITIINKKTKDMHHGYLHCKIGNIHFIVTHLSPFSYKRRLDEVHTIFKDIKSINLDKVPMVMLGDFNSLSPLDAERHKKSQEILEFLKDKEKKRKVIKNLNAGNYDYSVMETFMQNRLFDPITQQQVKTHRPIGTIPSAIVKENLAGYAKLLRRIDYILISKPLKKKVQDFHIPNNAALDAISDHYPVILTLTE